METLNFKVGGRTEAKQMVFWSVVLCMTYKVWKLINRAYLHNDPIADYIQYEEFNTIYRFLGTLIGFWLIRIYYQSSQDTFRLIHSWKSFLVEILYPVGFGLMVFVIDDVEWHWFRFKTELPFNFFTGFFEEFAMRGLLFVGLLQLLGLRKAILTSSLLFSLWHYDVYQQLESYISTFLVGVIMATLYAEGSSLVSLALNHFVWDQFAYGFERSQTPFSIKWFGWVLVLYDLLWVVVVFGWIKKRKATQIKLN